MTGVPGPHREDRVGVEKCCLQNAPTFPCHHPSRCTSFHGAVRSAVCLSPMPACAQRDAGRALWKGSPPGCSARDPVFQSPGGNCPAGQPPPGGTRCRPCHLPSVRGRAGQDRAEQSGVFWGRRCRKTLSSASGILAASPNLPGSWGLSCWH